MKAAKSHDDFMRERLADPKFAASYLQAALDEQDAGALFIAIRRVAESQGGLARLARETGLTREALYRTLSTKGNPRFDSFSVILHAIGVRMTIAANDLLAARSHSPARGSRASSKATVAVEPRPDGRWAVQTDGSMRADSLHDRKQDAVRRARELAENKRTELVIKNERGRIEGKDSHGRDPRSIPG